MIYKTKRIRRALKYIADNCYPSHWPSDDSIDEIDVYDAIEWLFEQAEDPKPKAVDVLLREMGAPELFPLDKLG